MIDPFRITNFQRTPAELEEFLLFCIVAAGKNAMQQAEKLEALLQPHLADMAATFTADDPPPRPMEVIDYLHQANRLTLELQRVRMGQYKRIFIAFASAMEMVEYGKHDLREVPVARLELISGIGPKTARFFVLHTRPDVRCAVLDTHVLSWLGEQGHRVPKTTPPAGLQYDRLEHAFLAECDKRGLTPAEFDLAIWTERTKNRPKGA